MRSFVIGLLICVSAGAADHAHISSCRGLFFRLFNPIAGRPVVHVPLDPYRIKENLPDTLNRYRSRGWLADFLLARFYRKMLTKLKPIETVSISGPRDLRKIFKPGQWYNLVVDEEGLVATPTGEYDADSFFPQGIGAKHMGLVASGRKPHFAGLAFFDGQNTLYVTNESGTFKPAGTTLKGFANLLKSEIPGLNVHSFQRTPPDEFDRQVMARFDSHQYKQADHAMIDPVGDAVLLGELGKKRKYANPVNKDEWASVYKEERQGRHGIRPPSLDGYTIGDRKAVISHRLVNAFHQVILDNPQFTPFLGPTPKWSPQAYDFLKTKLPFVPITPSKLFMAMMMGRSADFCPTGLEAQLEAKLLGYADNSIQMHDVFREAYVLAQGDVTKALLAAENVLAKDSHSPERDQTPLTKKLSYVRNDSEEIGDNYGAWYHTFGMLVFQMEHPRWMGQFVAAAEARGSSLYTLHDVQEQNSNFIGVEAGAGLRRLVETGAATRPLGRGARTDYMNLVEFPKKTSKEIGTAK